MPQVSARVPDEVEDHIIAFSKENEVTKSEAVRTILKRGIEYDRLQTENNRLNRSLQQLIEQREEHKDLIKYVEEERSLQQRREDRRSAPAWRRAKWWFLGRPTNKDISQERR